MKHTIEIEGLPEGWELVSIKLPDNCTKQCSDATISIHNVPGATFVLKKKQPRRIVLEEVTKQGDYFLYFEDRYWRIVEDSGENDD